MNSKVSQHAGIVRTIVDGNGQGRPSTHTNWLEDELSACGVPEFGLDQWLKHFMEEALASDLPDEKLLNFFCLARDKGLSEDFNFSDMLAKTEAALFSRMPSGLASTSGDATETDYEPDEHANAMEALCAGTLTDRHLVELFDLAASLRGEGEFSHMWQAVMYLSRLQILGRMRRVRRHRLSSSVNVAEPVNERGNVSLRQVLRIAEEAFRPDISDAQLLELYVLVEEHSNPDEEVFDEIADAVSAMISERLQRGSHHPELERYEPGFDYPDHGEQALNAVLKGNLANQNLLMLYRLSWDRERADPVWLSIHDLCRGQLLERMKGSSKRDSEDPQGRKYVQLTQRVQAYR